MILTALQHELGATGFRNLAQRKYTVTVTARGADLKYRCTVVCGICGRVSLSSNKETMKLTDTGIRSGTHNKCGT